MATWRFITPTVSEGPAGLDPLFRRLKLDRGVTILVTAGVYRSLRFPTQDEMAAADTVYMGGHEYDVDDTTKAALIAANVGVSEANFTAYSPGGYGWGRYGQGTYGIGGY